MSAAAKLLDRLDRPRQTRPGAWVAGCPCCQSKRGRPVSVRETEDPSPRIPSEVRIDPVQLAGMPKLYRIELLVSWGRGNADQRLRFVALRGRAVGLAQAPPP